jgi:hypothetical protein
LSILIFLSPPNFASEWKKISHSKVEKERERKKIRPTFRPQNTNFLRVYSVHAGRRGPQFICNFKSNLNFKLVNAAVIFDRVFKKLFLAKMAIPTFFENAKNVVLFFPTRFFSIH